VLGVEAADTWFAGIAEFPDVLRYVLATICDSRAHILTIDGIEYLGFLRQDSWETTLSEGRRLLESGVGKGWTEEYCSSLVKGLLAESSREFRNLLWDKVAALCHFTQSAGATVLTSYGRGAEHVVQAVLEAAERPLHFSEIAPLASARADREIDIRRAHNAAAAVGLLMARGVYGVERHLPLDRGAITALGEEAEDVVSDGRTGRQWHTSEILAVLVERGSAHALAVDKYVVDIALRRCGGLIRLGRMIWAGDSAGGDQDIARIDLHQAIVALLQQAARPLHANEIRQRLVAIRGVNEHFQISAGDPLLRVSAGVWGLNDRDFPVKRSDQPKFLDGIADILEHRGIAIHASELSSCLVTIPGLAAESILSLAASDARMRVNQAQHLYLAKWGGPRRESVSEAVEVVLATTSHPLSLAEILSQVEVRIQRKCEPVSIVGCLKAVEAVLDPATELWSRAAETEPASDDDVVFAD